MVGAKKGHALLCLILGAGNRVFATPTDVATTTRPSILRRLVNDASSSATGSSNVCHHAFEMCDSDADCAPCLEIHEDTKCPLRDTLVNSDHCDKIWGVFCCVFKNDAENGSCLTNDKLMGVMACIQENACPSTLPCVDNGTFDVDMSKAIDATAGGDKEAGDTSGESQGSANSPGGAGENADSLIPQTVDANERSNGATYTSSPSFSGFASVLSLSIVMYAMWYGPV